jgi:hypothetical protein
MRVFIALLLLPLLTVDLMAREPSRERVLPRNFCAGMAEIVTGKEYRACVREYVRKWRSPKGVCGDTVAGVELKCE